MEPGEGTVDLPRLGLGTAPMGDLYEHVDFDDAVAAVRSAVTAGYGYIDTAPQYGLGKAERVVGQALSGLDQTVLLSTKVGRRVDERRRRGIRRLVRRGAPSGWEWDFSASGVRRSLEASLARLNLDRVDAVFIHDPEEFVAEALDCAYPELERLRGEGLLRWIGVSLAEPTVAHQFVHDTDIDTVMIAGRYTLLDRSADDQLLDAAGAKGVHVIAAAVYNSGILTALEATPHYDYRPAPPELERRARRLADVCQEYGTTLRAAAVQFPARHPAVGTVLVGARNASEALDNLANFEAASPVGLWAALDAAAVSDRSDP